MGDMAADEADRKALCAYGPNTDADDEVGIDLHFIRELTSEEFKLYETGWRKLRTLTTSSAFTELREVEQELLDAMDLLDQRKEPSTMGAAGDDREIALFHRRFKTWLSALRSFDDRTSHWLSQELGKGHFAYSEFKRLLSHEFDTNFAYRLCCGLRNASEHASDVVNHITIRSSVDRATLAPEREVRLQMLGPELARAFPSIRTATRQELLDITGPLEVEWLIGSTTLSCQRAQAGLIVAIWETVEPSVLLIERLHQEAQQVNGEYFAVFLPLDAFTGNMPASIGWTVNPYHLAYRARENHAQALGNVGEQSAPLEPSDFIKDPVDAAGS